MAIIQPIPRDPIAENYKWREWFNKVANAINGTGGSAVDHNSLSSLQGGTSTERFHLTLAQNTGLTGGNQTTLHSHPDTVLTWLNM